MQFVTMYRRRPDILDSSGALGGVSAECLLCWRLGDWWRSWRNDDPEETRGGQHVAVSQPWTKPLLKRTGPPKVSS
jgi:hypothetical protein